MTPGAPWPRFNLKPFTRTINYETAMRDEFVRSQADPNARGGIPMTGEQKQMQAVSGNLAWSQTEPNPPGPALTAVGERLHQLWITPHGIIKAAATNNATAQAQTDGGKKLTVLSLTVPGQFSAKAYVNDNNLVEKVESWTTNPVLGDISTETLYSDYKDFGGVQFPTRITQKAGGHPTLDLTISEVKAGVAADIQPPDNVR